jgi:hypothetical protein
MSARSFSGHRNGQKAEVNLDLQWWAALGFRRNQRKLLRRNRNEQDG